MAYQFVWRQLGVCIFRCAASVAHFFIFMIGGYMSNNTKKRIIDVTGIELTPGEPSVCLGNGERGFECCCDECDYYLLCFTEFEKADMKK